MKFYKENQLDEYNSKGWVKIENLISETEVKFIKKEIKSFFKNKAKGYKGRNINFADNSKDINKINSFHRLSDIKWIKKLSKKNKFKKTADFFLNTKSKFIQSELFAKPAKVGLPSPVHQDNFYWCLKDNKALTIWIALDKVNSLNGGICYYEKSHKKGLMKHTPSFAKGSSQTIQNKDLLRRFKKIVPKLKPGDALVHHCLIAHGSKKNLSTKSREGITFQYKSNNSKTDFTRQKKYLRDLHSQIKK